MDIIPKYMGLHSELSDISGVKRNLGRENVHKYTKKQIIEREQTLRLMEREYPNVDKMLHEIIYDVVQNNTQERIDEILSNTKPSTRQTGGVIKACKVYESDGITEVLE
mgnify:CR=1 FL=1|tara:strand:+ start:902 stop:1228 length:327 start_codon:yes stop_codon:yes gene_type:complete